MKKDYFIFLLFAVICYANKSIGQTEPCATTKMYNKYKKIHPEISAYEKRLTDETIRYYQNHPMELSKFDRITSSTLDTQYYDIPVVVHVMHDYGPELAYLTDDFIYGMIADMNSVYAGLNSDLSTVIAPFQPYIGKTVIRFHLASIDPYGSPTNGITHHRTYLTYGGDDQAKMDQWSPINYYNIWFINFIGASSEPGAIILAYSTFPYTAASYPYNDGVISRFDADLYLRYTIEHETGHYFNLLHPWNNNGAGDGAINSGCGDDDVDDTPPTPGHFSTCSLYDTACDENYYKIYTNIHGNDSLVNYPDTANVQNIMDYSSCTNMFTNGQVQRMYASLNSNIGGRNNLYDSTNLINAGVWTSDYLLVAKPDLKPIPEFATIRNGVSSYMDRFNYFTFPGDSVMFYNESWNDTITNVTWIFSNIAAKPTFISTTNFYNAFSQPGWVDLKMTVTGNHTGDTTMEWTNAIFVADSTSRPCNTYIQEWDPNGDYAKWPYFNYYNNEFHWQLDTTVGFDDHYCMKYVGFDSRIDFDPSNPVYPATGSPIGDVDDLFSAPMDLSSMSDSCNLNFYYASASRSSADADITDTLEIDYVTQSNINAFGKISWQRLKILAKGDLINNGALATNFTPTSFSNWSPQSIPLPVAARTSYTTFRFRYRPNIGTSGYSSGNNFYLDRINFSRTPATANSVTLTSMDIAVVPNPTNGDAYVIIKDANNVITKVIITDITGKEIYTISQQIIGSEAQILIPRSAIAVAGIYLVQTITSNQTQTKKLVVY